ncbi:ABC transporter ATP-binding protein [Timonella sp. A28]|uniref:ABC transporter ATP-binding protein n=1 Tax=Timonella sp. A28 TaxID=3442640 RepID=UPI003EC0C1F2
MEKHKPAVVLSAVHKEFKAAHGIVKAVNGVDVTIERGEIVAFLGPNGAGKTTTIDMILGLTAPTSGSIEVGGDLPSKAVSDGKVSAVLQTGGLLRDLTVKETLQAIASLHNKSSAIADIVEKTGLAPLLDRRVSKCSGGEQQRLKFALALLPNPELLILDEPTAGMDVNARREFWATMQADAAAGRTIIFATHYLEEAEQYAQRTILINQGRIIADGATAHIRSIASGRVVSASFPETLDHATVTALENIEGVVNVVVHATRVKITASDSDAVALALLTTFNAHDVEISAQSLEAAFVNLTTEEQDSGENTGQGAAL